MPEAAELLEESSRGASQRLNRACFCITLDREALGRSLDDAAGIPGFWASVAQARPHLFSNVPVFLPKAEIRRMEGVVQAIEAAARLPGYRAAALAHAPDIARDDPGPAGAFMGYDFHLGTGTPKLIEVNTNAGGAFLNAALARAQRACCGDVDGRIGRPRLPDFERAIRAMFEAEWRRQGRSGTLRRIAIVDDAPQEQYLFPEFRLAERVLRGQGIDAVIADAADLAYADGRLLAGGQPVDLVYNRLVDFALALPEHAALRAAYRDGAVVVTPNPHVHALFADKRNLASLGDGAALRAWGLDPAQADTLAASVPLTVPVTAENAESLWRERRHLFFKPFGGHGGKAAYRGDKVTKGVWAEIGRGGYVAQAFAPPGERVVEMDGVAVPLKADVRLYTYAGDVLLVAARLYQGQTTNFRTPGGGFAPVFPV